MKTQQHKEDMDFIKLSEYIDYALAPITASKGIVAILAITFSMILGLIDSVIEWLSLNLIIHSMFIIMYAMLSTMDWVTGFIASVIVQKEQFKSGKFFKKPFLIMFCLFMLYATVTLSNTFSSYPHKDNPILQGVLHTVVFLFEAIKVGLLVSFVVYEMTSLRENFIKLKMHDFAKVLDWFLIPFVKINKYIEKKFDKVIEDEVGPEGKENEIT